MKNKIAATDKEKDIPSRGTGQAKTAKMHSRSREEQVWLWSFVGRRRAGTDATWRITWVGGTVALQARCWV